MKFFKIFIISLISMGYCFCFAQYKSNAAPGTSVALYGDTVSIGSSKAVVDFNLNDNSGSNNKKNKKWYNAFDLSDEEKARENSESKIRSENKKWQRKEFLTPKGIGKSYMGQSFLFFFWLGASQVFQCYNDYSHNPMACFQFLLAETSGIHRAGLMAFVVASGYVSTSAWLYNMGFKAFKRNRFAETLTSTSALTIGVSGQSVLMNFLQYYLQDPDRKRCANKYIIQQQIAEQRRWGKKVSDDDAIEDDACRLAADKNTFEYMETHMPPEIASLWATMPILFALQTSLGMAVSPSGLGLVSGLQKLTQYLSEKMPKGSAAVGGRFNFYITMEKVSQKLGTFYRMTFNLKQSSKVFQLAEYLLKPGSWWHSGLNLLAFIGISEALAPAITETYFKKISSDFDASNQTFLKTMTDMGSMNSRNFLVKAGCNNENAATCEPPASLFLSQLRKDFTRWREIKMQSVVATYQGWQEKIQGLVSGFNASLRFYREVALPIFKIKTIVPPWRKQTTLGGVYPLVPDNVNDERDLFISPVEYYGSMGERAFIIGLGLKTYISFYAQESKLKYQSSMPQINKDKIFNSLIEEFKNNFKNLNDPEIKSTFERIKSSRTTIIKDFEILYKTSFAVLQKSSHNETISKFRSNKSNSNYVKWLEKFDQIANKLMAGFLLNAKDYGVEYLRVPTTSVKKYVQIPEYKDYTHPLFLDEQKDAQLSIETPMKMFGADPELVRVIEIVGKLYYTNILRDSDYLYYISKDQYSELQEGINELMGVVNFVNHKDYVDSVTSAVAKFIPQKAIDAGLFSYDSLHQFRTFDRKTVDWLFREESINFVRSSVSGISIEKSLLFEIPAQILSRIYNNDQVAEITKLTNTIYSGLGTPFAPQNEAQAFKERYMRYTIEGRNHSLYPLPKKTNRIMTKTIFDSMIIGMICGPERPEGIFKVSHTTWNDPDDVDFKDFFPDRFKPFRIVNADNPKVKSFCSKTIATQDELNKNLPEAFSILESELGSLKIPKLSQELIRPEYGAFIITLYCNMSEWDRESKKNGKIKNWSITSKTWSKYEAMYCGTKDGVEVAEKNNINDQSLSWNEINALINETSDLVNSLSNSDRDDVIRENIKFIKSGSGKVDELDIEDMYRALKFEALNQTLAIRGTLVLEKIFQNYELLYNAKLPLLEEVMLGKGGEAKKVREMINANYQDIKSLKYSDVLDHGKEVVSPRVAPLTENKFQEPMALALLQESSYYLAFFSKVYTYYFNENARFENKNAELMMQMSPFLENYNKNASLFQTVLAQVGAVDTKYYLPRAPMFIWTINNLVTDALKAIINKEDKKSKAILTKLNELIDYLDIVVLKIKLAEDNYTSEQLAQLQSTFSAEGAKELNLPASERAVMRTWLVHFRSFVFDLMSLSSMIQPLDFENASSQNYK